MSELNNTSWKVYDFKGNGGSWGRRHPADWQFARAKIECGDYLWGAYQPLGKVDFYLDLVFKETGESLGCMLYLITADHFIVVEGNNIKMMGFR